MYGRKGLLSIFSSEAFVTAKYVYEPKPCPAAHSTGKRCPAPTCTMGGGGEEGR